jgi:class 3 adenylate cyclase
LRRSATSRAATSATTIAHVNIGVGHSDELTDDRVLAGRAAIERDAFGEALSLLSAADAEHPLEPADLDRLGDAHAWAGHIEDALATWERACGAHLAAKDPRSAAMSALLIARESLGLGRRSVATGWYRRAARLLEGAPECSAHGYLALAAWSFAIARGDHDEAVALGERVLELGTRFGDPDLQALGLLRRGVALIARGETDEGLELLDEATSAAVAGDLGSDATFIVYCATVSVCRDLADYGRAGDWAAAARRWCARRAISGFPGICRIYHAELLRLRGAWAEAEAEVRSGCAELERAGLHSNAGAGYYELGEIRLRMGDLAAADSAFCKAHEAGRDPQPGLALVRVAQARTAEAVAAMTRALEEHSADRLARARLLAAWVEIALASAEVDRADAAARELSEIASVFGTPALGAHAAAARASVSLARGDPESGLSSGRAALAVWQELDLPYEAARARLTVAAALSALGDDGGAALELRAAASAFVRLGARLDARRAAEALPDEESTQPAGTAGCARAFMFTDIVKSTEVLAAIGDDAWVSARAWHDRTVRPLFRAHGGEEITHTGDGFFVAFPTAPAAIDCAIEIQRMLDQHRQQLGFALGVRIGLHAASATRTVDDYAGRGVHEAARIAALAQGGEILASRTVLSLAPAGVQAGGMRSAKLKGLPEPVDVAAIDWRP